MTPPAPGPTKRRRGLRGAARLDALIRRRPLIAVVVAGLLCGLAVVSVSWWVGEPLPKIHDEFCYLLAADTFSHGRLANPPHAQWQHFETFHTLMQPTYASKFPPGQGLSLAVGQSVFGRPLVGVWLFAALFVAAVGWMLLAWVPARWAVLGAILAGLRLVIPTYWGQSYWGGCVAGLGGALLFGGVRRGLSDPRPLPGIAMGLGLTILMLTRPYEGFVVSLPVAGLLLVWGVRRVRSGAGRDVARLLLPLGIVVAGGLAFLARYDSAVTGSVWPMPYEVYQRTYAVEPVLLVGSPSPEPEYRHEVMRRFYLDWEAAIWREQTTIEGMATVARRKFRGFLSFYFGGVLLVPLLFLPWVRRTRWRGFALLACAFLAVGHLVATFLMHHYSAPVAGLLVYFVVEGLRRATRVRVGSWRAGRWAVAAVLAALTVADLRMVAAAATERRGPVSGFARDRADVTARLLEQADDDLVIVRYGPQHNFHREWVSNAADIDGAPVVWARDMGADRNRDLLSYFAARRAWLLTFEGPDETPILQAHPDAATGG